MNDSELARYQLDYLVQQELEERGERRGLEQRALALSGALLIGLPVFGTVARGAETNSGWGLVGLVISACAVIWVIILVGSFALAFGTDEKDAGMWRGIRLLLSTTKTKTGIRAAREDLMHALSSGNLEQGCLAQARVVEGMRKSNRHLIDSVRVATRQLPVVLMVMLAGLAILVQNSTDPRGEVDAGPMMNPDETVVLGYPWCEETQRDRPVCVSQADPSRTSETTRR